MIIITGGAGFIGSVVARTCNLHGRTDLIIVDNLQESDKWRNLVKIRYQNYLHKNQFIQAIQAGQVDPKSIDAIIHMGACSATTESNMDYLMENNYRYTLLLSQWAMEHRIRFIYASSAATYGDGEQGFDDDHSRISTLIPINRYGYSKQLFDQVALQRGWLNKMVGLKFFNVFGPNEYHKGDMRSVICKSHALILEDGEMQLFKSYRPDYSDGGQKRDFVYVKDCADVIWWLLENPQVNGVYNLGTGQARSWNDLASALFKAMNKPEKITYVPMPEPLKNQYQYFTEATMSKLTTAGYSLPFTSLEDAVMDYVTCYLDGRRYF